MDNYKIKNFTKFLTMLHTTLYRVVDAITYIGEFFNLATYTEFVKSPRDGPNCI